MRLESGLLAVGLSGFAMLSGPPMKMGLWEITSTSTSHSTGKMADAMKQAGQPDGVPTTQTMKMCVTEETWEKSLGGMREAAAGCTRSDVVSTPQKTSSKVSCTRGSSTMVSDSVVYIDSSDLVHGTTRLTTSSPAGSMTSDSTSKAKFLGPNCGDVKPIGTLRH